MDDERLSVQQHPQHHLGAQLRVRRNERNDDGIFFGLHGSSSSGSAKHLADTPQERHAAFAGKILLHPTVVRGPDTISDSAMRSAATRSGVVASRQNR